MSALKPGTLCLIVAGCPENIGLVVEVVMRQKGHRYLIKTITGRNFPQLHDSYTGQLAEGNDNREITDRHKLRPLDEANANSDFLHPVSSDTQAEHQNQQSAGRTVEGVRKTLPTGRSVVPFPDIPAEPLENPTGSYPYLVIRIYSAVYQRESIDIRQGDPSVHIGPRCTYVQHPSPWYPESELSLGARQLLLQGVSEAVTRLGFRMCVVWGKESCSFVERNGIINESTEPPSGGVALPVKIAFDRREPFVPSP